MKVQSVTCIAPTNIAVIKYWGKRDEKLILPLNDSLSGTLSTDQMCAKTTISASPEFKNNRIWLNGNEEDFNNPRLVNCLRELKARAEQTENSNKELLKYNIHVCSVNNFPTAAGLASSAAGYACFVYTLATLYNLGDTEISAIARQGSGSACRSIYGGFVQWKMGELDDGTDSFAEQIVPANYWPEMRVLIIVINDTKKKTSSTGGMTRSTITSELLKHRVAHCVPQRMRLITDALKKRNFPAFGEIVMKDSNQFHATCLDTYPPCVYMNDISHSIVEFVHEYNAAHNEVKVAYTFDAGPNACLYMLQDDVPKIISLLNKIFPNDMEGEDYIKGFPVNLEHVSLNIEDKIGTTPKGTNLFKYLIHTKIGEGPVKLDDSASLLNDMGIPY